ncbi:putative P-loop containing nucleoside triphosphate hydrolase, leucine-rich repeat domain superfamily [Helianthus debilis subsp. tardiflorus]
MEQMLYDQVVAPVVKFMTSHIMKHLGYVICSTKHVTSMREKMSRLVATSTDVMDHKNRNKINDKEIPAGVEAWLGEVEKVKDQVQSIPNDDIGCLHMKNRYRAGRNASKATMRIQELITENSEITWTDAPLATGRATSSTTSTPLSSSPGGDDFKSRDVPFNDALKLLQQDDNKSQVIALCGMGGVGKTTMMEQLKKVAEDKKMFDFFVKVTLGRNPNMLSIQNDIAVCIGGEGLREETVTARADSLRTKFEKTLEDGKKKILVILDDVWEKVDIKDIGLTSPLPKGVKLLLTSTIGNLRKLKLLDLTGCVDLHIDDGVFKNLVKLEELYMRCSRRKRIHLTDANLEELKMLSCQLCALEVEFYDMNHLKDLSFEKLDKFKISIGGGYFEYQTISFKTRLVLNLMADHRSGLVDDKIHELVKKSESLLLSMKHMSGLEDFVPVNPYDQSLFLYLRDFSVDGCDKLKYLFPTHVTRGLRKLERLTIWSCSVLEAVVHDYNGEINGKGEMIIFEELKYLSLGCLPKLVRLFPVDSVVELPQLVELKVDRLPSITSIYPDNKNTSALQQALFNSQVRTLELKDLCIDGMKNLKQIWPSSSEEEFDNIPMLRDVSVVECRKLVNLFPTNPMRLLKHLEEIKIVECSRLREIFNIDLECFVEVEQVINISLRYICVRRWNNEEECHVWSIKGGERNSSFHDFDTTGWVRKPYGLDAIYEKTSHQPSPNLIRLRREIGNMGEVPSGQVGADTRLKGKL